MVYLSIFLGFLFILFCSAIISSSVILLKSHHFGNHFLIIPFVFSLLHLSRE